MTSHRGLGIAGLSLWTALAMAPREAAACGCFVNPTVTTTPVIQAGERILFAVENGQVTAHIQIQYQGKAEDFGWLLPLPSVPTLEVGTDELFAVLQSRTDPKVTTTTNNSCQQSSTSFGCGADAKSTSLNRAGAGCSVDADCGPHALCFNGICVVDLVVVQDSVGPYDYAVLKADDKTAMLDWLAKNRYVVPGGTDETIAPYIHPGAYFLALKLKSGKDAGDIQPVVVHYASDLPMIPIILTAVAATPDMGILVWVLGEARAIPRNYHHTVLSETALALQGDYNKVLLQAVNEAPKHHTFITEYAGATLGGWSALRVPALDGAKLAVTTDASAFASALAGAFGSTLPKQLQSILAAHIAEPDDLIKQGISSSDFYARFDHYMELWDARFPGHPPLMFDAKATAEEIVARLVDPPRKANDLMGRYPLLTRLHTVLSPKDMTDDPVFSFNDSLPSVSPGHNFTRTTDCDGNVTVTVIDEGLSVHLEKGAVPPELQSLPASRRIETLRESGPGEVVTDNLQAIQSAASGTGGCAVASTPASRGSLLLVMLLGGAAAAGRRRRRR